MRLPLSQMLKIFRETDSFPIEWSDEETFLNIEVNSDEDDATSVDSRGNDDDVQ